MLGVVFLRVVIDAVAKLVKVGADEYQGIIVGVLVVLAVAFNELRRAGGGLRKQFFPGVLGFLAIGILSVLGGTITHNDVWPRRRTIVFAGALHRARRSQVC